MTTAMTKYKLRFDSFLFIFFSILCFLSSTSRVEPKVVDCRFALMFALFVLTKIFDSSFEQLLFVCREETGYD